jgi:hypothetical protein
MIATTQYKYSQKVRCPPGGKRALMLEDELYKMEAGTKLSAGPLAPFSVAC